MPSMDYFVYLVFRAFVGVIEAMPLRWVYRLGGWLGFVGYILFAPYRWLAIHNLTIAYGEARSPAEVRALARQHFVQLGANLLSSIKAASFSADQLHEIVDVEGIEHLLAAFERGKGIVLIISHIGNWELFAQLCQFLPEYQWGTVYQPLGNPHIEAYVQRTRTHRGVAFVQP